MLSTCQPDQAAHIIRQGGIIACPTEAVWGLSCDPLNEPAVRRILQLKQRSASKGLILVAASSTQFSSLLNDLDDSLRQQLEDSWPGPNTWLVPHRQRLPEWITGQHASVALRVSAHPLLQQLCQLAGPLVSTSANPAGQPAATSRQQVEDYFGNQLDCILEGPLGGQNQPSSIRDLLSGKIIRQ